MRFALGEDGEWRTRNYANVAAEVGGGVPGSGKTAGERSLACSLLQHPAVQYVVIDENGGSDWSWIAPRAAIYCPEDDNLTAVLAAVQTVRGRDEAPAEDAAGRAWFGGVLGPASCRPEHPVIVVTVGDEVQTFTETKAIPDPETEGTRCPDHPQALAVLVKKGRSGGIMTRLLTQKPTTTPPDGDPRQRLGEDGLAGDLREAAEPSSAPSSAGRQSRRYIPECRPGVAVVASAGGSSNGSVSPLSASTRPIDRHPHR